MGLGETQVFQDEKSRLANTTVARIVAAKGSLNDPETKKECCRKLQKLNATLKDRVAAVDAAMARDAMKGGVTGLGCDNRKLIAVLCTRTKASLDRTKAQYRAKFDADLAKDVREKTGSDYGRMMVYALAAPDHRSGAAAPGDVPGDLSARSWTGKSPARPRAEHGPGDDSDRARGRRCRLRVLTRPIRHRRDTSHAGPGGQFVVPLPAPPPPRGPLYPYMAPGHGG